MKPSPISAIPRFSADEIRRIVSAGEAAGLVQRPGATTPSVARPVQRPVAKLAQPGAPVPSAGPMRSVWVDVTPEQAADWLRNNFVNRPLVEDVVAAYARDMRNGIWVPTHQGIAFNDLNALIDGQHRLSAIVRTGLTMRMMVTYGLPAKIEGKQMTTMDAVDRGRTRTVADQLKIQHGMVNGTVIAAVSASLGGLCFNGRTKRLSVGQTLEIYHEFAAGVEFVIERRSKSHGLRAAGVLAAFAFAYQASPDKFEVGEMFVALVDGTAKPQSAMAALHSFLTSPDARLLTRGADRALAELVLHAIHLQLEGATVDKLAHAFAGMERFRALQPERVAKIAEMFKLPEA